MTVLGFHGTSRDVAEEVLAGRAELKVSKSPWEWLGDGVYFWENGPERALEWARQRRKNSPRVVGAVIQVGHCLNLMDKSSNVPLAEAYERCESTFEIFGQDFPENKDKFHYRDRIVINTLHSIAEANQHPYDTVRAAYLEGNPVYPGTELMTDTHTFNFAYAIR